MFFDFITREWFFSKQEMVFGPFTYQEVLQMLYVGTVHEQDLVRQGEQAEWVKLIEHSLFSKEALAELHNYEGFDFDEKILNELFVRRTSYRTQIEIPILLIDGTKIIKAQTIQLGAGGVRIKLDETYSHIQVDRQLRVHVKQNQAGVSVFNVRGRITNVEGEFVSIEFLDIPEELKHEINEFAMKRAV